MAVLPTAFFEFPVLAIVHNDDNDVKNWLTQCHQTTIALTLLNEIICSIVQSELTCSLHNIQ